MSVQQHRSEASASAEPLRAIVVVVSSTRTASTDRSGERIAEMLAAGGCEVGERVFVDDEIAAIRGAITDLVSRDVPAVIVTGGTGIASRDVTPEALSPMLQPVLDGFGELFRWLSFQEIGAAAMLSRAVAGLCGRTVVFALPGSVAACELAVERLILPELAHLVHLARQGRGAPAGSPLVGSPLVGPPPASDIVDVPFEPVSPAAQPTPDLVAQAQRGAGTKLTLGASDTPSAPAPTPEEEIGWLRTVKLWGGQLSRDAREPIPEELERIAPVFDVLSRAGAFGTLITSDGRQWALYGYPDLIRPNSKVLAARLTASGVHVLALHRWPSETGTCVDGEEGPTPDRTQTIAVTERITGRRPSGEPGPLFAVSGDTVWYTRGRSITRFDGRKESDQGTPNQALASLVLEWSQR